MIKNFKICQHNTARSRDILHSLFEVALQEEAHILLVQEPYFYFNKDSNQYCHLSHPAYYPILPMSDLSIRPRVIVKGYKIIFTVIVENFIL